MDPPALRLCFTWMLKDVPLLNACWHWTHRSTIPVSSLVERPSGEPTPHRMSAWLPVGNRTSLLCNGWRQQPQPVNPRGFGSELLDHREPTETQLLMPSQQLVDLRLASFHLRGPADARSRLLSISRVRPPARFNHVNRCIRAAFIGFDPRLQERIHGCDLPRGFRSFEAISPGGFSVGPPRAAKADCSSPARPSCRVRVRARAEGIGR